MLIVLTLMSVTMMAQGKGKYHKTPEQFDEAQAHYIASQLAFDDQTTAMFVKTYCDYRAEIRADVPREHHDDMSESEAEQAINDRFERNQKILDIRKKYYQEYSKFLTQKQIERVYELEHESMKKLSKHQHKGKKQ